MMKTKFLLFVVFVCLIAAPVRAELFSFDVGAFGGGVNFTYDGVVSVTTMSLNGITAGSLWRPIPTMDTARFSDSLWGTGSELFMIDMTLSNITSETADATGSMTFVDVDGSTIAASLTGQWRGDAGIPIFFGELTDVTFTPTAATFDGHTGDSVSMQFAEPQPWAGIIYQEVHTINWFTPGTPIASIGGLVQATVRPVPVPGAVLLGMLGLGFAGIKLRKHA